MSRHGRVPVALAVYVWVGVELYRWVAPVGVPVGRVRSAVGVWFGVPVACRSGQCLGRSRGRCRGRGILLIVVF